MARQGMKGELIPYFKSPPTMLYCLSQSSSFFLLPSFGKVNKNNIEYDILVMLA